MTNLNAVIPILMHVVIFYVPGSDSGDILFLHCLFVCWFVCLTNLTFVITFEPFEIEPLYLARRFLATRAFHSYKKKLTHDLDLDLCPSLKEKKSWPGDMFVFHKHIFFLLKKCTICIKRQVL